MRSVAIMRVGGASLRPVERCSRCEAVRFLVRERRSAGETCERCTDPRNVRGTQSQSEGTPTVTGGSSVRSPMRHYLTELRPEEISLGPGSSS